MGVVTKATLPTPVTESPLTGTAPLLRFIIHQALVIFLSLPPQPHKKQRAFLLSLESCLLPLRPLPAYEPSTCPPPWETVQLIESFLLGWEHEGAAPAPSGGCASKP